MAIEDEIMANIQTRSDETENGLSTFRMIYKNTNNELSDRVVDLIRFNITEKRKNFYAYDHLKNEFREFSIKRIQRLWIGNKEITNPQTYLISLYSPTSDTKEYQKNIVSPETKSQENKRGISPLFTALFVVFLFAAFYLNGIGQKTMSFLCGVVCVVCVIVPLIKEYKEMSRTERKD